MERREGDKAFQGLREGFGGREREEMEVPAPDQDATVPNCSADINGRVQSTYFREACPGAWMEQ